MMSRTERPDNGRKKEFVETSRRLFNENGFENTSVNDIVNAMNVAKGLFYYYFKAKDDVLYSIVDEMVEDVRLDLDEVLSKDYDSALDQLYALIKPSNRVQGHSSNILEYFREKRNKEFYNFFVREARVLLRPALISTITRGISEGMFNVDFPPETADLLLSAREVAYYAPDLLDTERDAIVNRNLSKRLLGISDR